ncbi:hypothetical protein HMPREF9104_00637 [Lentilactobacillus kisonensis F0435]|uniref:Uncharacterized protein n=1 Tax=Lentilactobacillus kisonensis F0435 TaxID=797516 RepID=H1LDG9_9LACO|nr:hypothetical protein HMPREF9104_00637 [Lentilactobacillus kisonensis F0435]
MRSRSWGCKAGAGGKLLFKHLFGDIAETCYTKQKAAPKLGSAF